MTTPKKPNLFTKANVQECTSAGHKWDTLFPTPHTQCERCGIYCVNGDSLIEEIRTNAELKQAIQFYTSAMSLPHIIELVVGDFSGDGHDRKRKQLYRSNLTCTEVERAYKKGCEIVGFELDKESEYRGSESCKLEQEPIQALIANGVDMSAFLRIQGFDPNTYKLEHDVYHHLTIEGYLFLWLSIAKIGNTTLAWQEFEPNCIDVGGYNLFM